MRVLEPHHLQAKKKRRSKRRVFQIWLAVIGVICLCIVLNIAAGRHLFSHSNKNTVELAKDAPAQAPVPKLTKPKQFTPNQFRDLYRSVLPSYPNTQTFIDPPEITGNKVADERIRKIAEARGFKQTRQPVTALIKTNEPMLEGETDDLLQPLAYRGWIDIKAEAKKDGVPLALYSAFRSPEWQRDLFMKRLLARGVSINQVAAGDADDAVAENLNVTAVPGYSRHHTGYTVDFWCSDNSGAFRNSTCFKWLEDNNYANAKQFGWIPSYPEGADEQGPEPEAWEYVWVGKSLLYE